MIEEHITLHDESTTFVVTYSSYVNTSWPSKSAEQKKEWQDLIALEHSKAMGLCRPGDMVGLKSNTACVIEIMRFETDPEKVVAYKDLPCVIKGVIKTWQNPDEISYSLPELDWQTRVPAKNASIITLPEGCNDEC